MFDAGKILTAGGSESFAMEEFPATGETHLLTIGAVDQNPSIKPLSGMKKSRVYGNGVALPDGKVLVTGGAFKPKEFSDEFAHYQPGTLPASLAFSSFANLTLRTRPPPPEILHACSSYPACPGISCKRNLFLLVFGAFLWLCWLV